MRVTTSGVGSFALSSDSGAGVLYPASPYVGGGRRHVAAARRFGRCHHGNGLVGGAGRRNQRLCTDPASSERAVEGRKSRHSRHGSIPAARPGRVFSVKAASRPDFRPIRLFFKTNFLRGSPHPAGLRPVCVNEVIKTHSLRPGRNELMIQRSKLVCKQQNDHESPGLPPRRNRRRSGFWSSASRKSFAMSWSGFFRSRGISCPPLRTATKG